VAGYTHLHALATPEWAKGLLDAARHFAPRSVHRSPSPIEAIV
jgi:hypothetical protein